MNNKMANGQSTRTPAVQLATKYIREQIANGQYRTGSRLPAEEELASLTNLSRGTIRRAIAELIDAGELMRRPSSRPIVVSKRPPNGQTEANEIHVWISQPIANPVTVRFLQGVSSGLMGTKYRTVVREPLRFHDNYVVEEEREFLQNVLQSPQAAGAIVERDPFARNDDLFEELIRQGRHIVFVDIPAPAGLNADHVGTNNVSAARKATSHLISKGHQDILFVTDSDVVASSRARMEGYWRALAQAGLKEKGRVIVAVNLNRADDVEMKAGGDHLPYLGYSPRFSELARRAVREILLLPKLPTAIFVNCDALAFWVISYLEGAGIAVPGQIAVMGFDWIARWEDSQIDILSTLSQDFEGFGIHAADLLLDRLNETSALPARHVLLDATLVLRKSTNG